MLQPSKIDIVIFIWPRRKLNHREVFSQGPIASFQELWLQNPNNPENMKQYNYFREQIGKIIEKLKTYIPKTTHFHFWCHSYILQLKSKRWVHKDPCNIIFNNRRCIQYLLCTKHNSYIYLLTVLFSITMLWENYY